MAFSKAIISSSKFPSKFAKKEMCEPLAHVDSEDAFVCFRCNLPSCICEKRENNLDKAFLAFAAQMQSVNLPSNNRPQYKEYGTLINQPVSQNLPSNSDYDPCPNQGTRHPSPSHLVPNPFFGLLPRNSVSPPSTTSSTPSLRNSPPALVANPFFGLLNKDPKK